jgi:Flp pilus assembly pilin Flp
MRDHHRRREFGVIAMRRTDEAATSVEYALTAGLIAVAIAVSVGLLGDAVAASFQGFVTAMGW